MVVKSDQEHVRALLTEAIRVLCKNRLNYKAQLNIEGLIGITLDTEDIFLVNIKETVIKEETEEVEFIDKLMSNAVNHSRPGRQRKSTPRHLSVVTSPSILDQDPDDQECTWQLADGTDIEDLSPLDLVQFSSQKHFTSSLRPLENGIDAPLNLSYPSSKKSKDSKDESTERLQEDQPENLVPQKRKRLKREETESVSSATSTSCSSSKRSRSLSNASSPSPARFSPVPPMVTVKQEPVSYPIPTPHHNGILLQPNSGVVAPHTAVPIKAGSPTIPGAPSDKRVTPGRNNHLESIIWQRLSAAVNPIHMSTPLIPSQANYVCPVCGRRMQHLGGWTRHVERCGTPRFCHVCGKQFKTSNSLRVHRFHYHRTHQSKSSSSSSTSPSSSKKSTQITKLADNTNTTRAELQKTTVDLSCDNQREREEDSITSSSRSESPSENQEQPVLKVPLYSISGKLKKEKGEKAPTTKDTGTTKENLPIRESNTSNTENMIIPERNPRVDKVINLDNKPLKRIESKLMNNGQTEFDSVGKPLEHCYSEKGMDLHIDNSHNSSSDGYHSMLGDSADQENIEVLSIDSDDDVKTEDFIERSQEPGKAVSYKCKLCDRVYSNKWNCRRHIQYTHMNKSSFTCEICHNKYRDRSDYQEHMMVIHQGPGGYKCEFCDKILMSKRSLKEHVSLHTGQYRYHCMDCSRGFNRLNDYQLHMTKDHGNKIANMTGPEIAAFLDNSQKAVLPEPIIP